MRILWDLFMSTLPLVNEPILEVFHKRGQKEVDYRLVELLLGKQSKRIHPRLWGREVVGMERLKSKMTRQRNERGVLCNRKTTRRS